MASDFQFVKRKKQRRPHKTLGSHPIDKYINEIRTELVSTQFFKETCTLICSQPDTELVCYGLGNFAESYIARYQLAFLMALRDEIQVPKDRCEIYDPQFTPEEVKLLAKHDFKVLEENQEGKRLCPGPTILYMPHCGKALYNNLLWSNWGPHLTNLVIIGNSFTTMLDRTPSRILQETASYVMKIQPYIHEAPLQVPAQYEDVFNDTSIHSFLLDRIKEVPQELWENNLEPKYKCQDAEIILR